MQIYFFREIILTWMRNVSRDPGFIFVVGVDYFVTSQGAKKRVELVARALFAEHTAEPSRTDPRSEAAAVEERQPQVL